MGAFRKLRPGDGIEAISAGVYNSFIDYIGSSDITGGSGADLAAARGAAIIRVRNVSGSTVNQYHTLALKEPTIKPLGNTLTATDSESNDFKSRLVFDVVTPTAAYVGRWCVLLRPLNANEFGTAVSIGVVQARINLTTASHKFVEVGSNFVLASGTSGSAQILWVAGGVGTATATGEQWAVIKIDSSGSSLPAPTAKYQVYTPVDDSLVPVWTVMRFS